MTPKFIFSMAVLLIVQPFLFAQDIDDIITEKEATRIIYFLANDSLKGRGNGSPSLLKAGLFIGDEFKKSGLQIFPGNAGYYMPFRPFGGSKNIVIDDLVWNGKKLVTDAFLYFHPEPGNYSPKNLSDFTIIKIDSFFTENILERHKSIKKNLLLWSDQPQPDKENYFPLKINMPPGGLNYNVLLVCASTRPTVISLSGVNSYYSNAEYNVVGLLPGKTKPGEVVLFSAHYDHEGVFDLGKKKDSILNGANDNASGVTALLMLAKYFVQKNDNERTILFCAFAGEELGLSGSKDFVNDIDPASIIAGINIEMIGIPQYGKNNIYITGYNQSSLPSILEKQLSATSVRVKPGPPETKEMFKRSDNFPFVEKGIPAHSIMSSDDDEECYHQPCDEIKRINISHLTTIVRAIATATRKLMSGDDTPSRVISRE
ncbi:MAG: M28 family peptidase [Chitinophagaceae bacterium]